MSDNISEKEIQNNIRVALSEAGCKVWRNNAGFATYHNGEVVKYGVANPGGSDLIGIAPGGYFVAIEVKTNKGKATEAQENFIRVIKEMGGRAGIAHNAQEALEIVK